MRKPDFWVVKKTVDGKELWRTYIGPTEFCPCRSGRARYFSMTEAARQAESHPGSKAVPVYCTTRKVEPKMRSRSSAWVLRRLAEGKVVMVERSDGPALLRFNARNFRIEYRSGIDEAWYCSSGFTPGQVPTGLILCRIVHHEEVPT